MSSGNSFESRDTIYYLMMKDDCRELIYRYSEKCAMVGEDKAVRLVHLFALLITRSGLTG